MTDQVHHGPSMRTFILIWAALIVLTATTVGVSYLELGVMNPVVALVIATIKALLVILVFMEVRYSPKITMMVIVSGVFFLLLLLSLTLSDFLSRGWGQAPR
jgi:cytochrome c oxidase subunit 4